VGAYAKTTTTERLRPNKYAATALLSRAYLYANDWTNAEIQASAIISNSASYDTTELKDVFLKNSKEAIWQLQPVNIGWNTEDARIFILPSSGPTGNSSVSGYPVFMSNSLLNLFEPGDQRKTNWINAVTIGGGTGIATYYFPYKYKCATLNNPVTEYTMILRLGEQYLIRGEARAQLNKIPEALADINVVRIRARLPSLTINDKNSLLNAILRERQVELFTEWGSRWLDLKRTNTIDPVMNGVASTKGTTWNTNWALYPIPIYDITQNPNLIQNSGY
jgi:starch-binding outer membrane protein, SusD/RagB family